VSEKSGNTLNPFVGLAAWVALITALIAGTSSSERSPATAPAPRAAIGSLNEARANSDPCAASLPTGLSAPRMPQSDVDVQRMSYAERVDLAQELVRGVQDGRQPKADGIPLAAYLLDGVPRQDAAWRRANELKRSVNGLQPTRKELLASLSAADRLWFAALYLRQAGHDHVKASEYRRGARELLAGVPPSAPEYGDALLLRALAAPTRPRRIGSSPPLQAVTAAPICAENGSCYGDISAATGRPKTVNVSGYYRRDGTYVSGYYRSTPR
jgi:hypothetical protein